MSRLEQIINNLLSNALKYSVAGSDVKVIVRPVGNTAVLAISDQGIGMEQDLLKTVYEPFVQGPSLGHRASSGLGIGLALVKQLVELHGGTVSAHSAGTGLGSQFTVELPRLPVVEIPEQPQPRQDVASLTKPLRLLLVEDNEDARLTMIELLQAYGVSIKAARDGFGGIAFAESEHFDVAVFDIGLPDMTGYELAQRVHGLQPSLPLIALTGYGQDQDKDHAYTVGFAKHLTKPISIETLMEAIQDVVPKVV